MDRTKNQIEIKFRIYIHIHIYYIYLHINIFKKKKNTPATPQRAKCKENITAQYCTWDLESSVLKHKNDIDYLFVKITMEGELKKKPKIPKSSNRIIFTNSLEESLAALSKCCVGDYLNYRK